MSSPNTLQSQVSYNDYLAKNPTLAQETPDIQAKVARQFFDSQMAKQPGWTQETPEVQNQAWGAFQQKYNIPAIDGGAPIHPEPKASWQNLGNAIGGGIGGAVKSLTDLNTYATMGGQIGQSFQTEAQSLNDPMGLLGALGQGAVKGVRDLGQGVLSLPSDIQNAAYGQQVSQPMFKIPEIPTAWNQNLQQHPVAGFVGEQLPYAIPVGRAFGAGKALEEANALRQLGRAAAEGAVIGGVIDPQGQGLQGRFQNAATAAAVTPAFYGAGQLVGKIAQRMPEPKAVEMKPQKIDRPIGLAGLSREPQLQVSARIAPEDGVQIINTQQRPQLAIPDNADLSMMPPVDERAAQLAAHHEAQHPQGKAAQEADYKAKVSAIVDEFQQMHEIDQKEFRKEVLKGAAKKINVRNRKRDNPNFQINRDILKEIMDREKAQKQAEIDAKNESVGRLTPEEIKLKIEIGVRANRKSKTAKTLFEQFLSKYQKEDKAIIKAGVQDAINAEKAQLSSEALAEQEASQALKEAETLQSLKTKQSIADEQARQKAEQQNRDRELSQLKQDILSRHKAELEAEAQRLKESKNALKEQEALLAKNEKLVAEQEANAKKIQDLKAKQDAQVRAQIEREAIEKRKKELNQLKADIESRNQKNIQEQQSIEQEQNAIDELKQKQDLETERKKQTEETLARKKELKTLKSDILARNQEQVSKAKDAQKQAEKAKPNEQKAQTKQQERPEQPAPQNQPAGEQGQLTAKAEKTVKLTLAQERDAIAETLGNMTANNAVEPNAYDFFNQFGMKIRKINKAQGLAYQVTLPRYGTVTFTPKDTINSVIRQMRASRKSGQPDPLTSIAGVIRARGGLEAMRAELDALFSGQGDSYTNMESTGNLFDYAETKAANEVAGRYAEEDAHFTRIEDTYKAKIQNAKTFDDLDQIQQELEQIPEATYLADSLVDTYSAKIAELAKAGDNTNEAPIQEQAQPQRSKELPKNTGNDKASERSPRQQEVIAKPFPKQAKPEPGEYVHPAGAQFIPEELTGRSYSKFEDLGNGKPVKNALAQLSPDQKKALQTLVQAARQHKKVLARFYDVVDPAKRQKRAGYEDELSSVLGFSVTKDENLLVHTYNELGQLSTRRMDQFSGDIEITKHGAYNGRHPSRYREPGKFNPVDALYERTMNPILKREALRQPIDPADYKLAAERFMDAYKDIPEGKEKFLAAPALMKMPTSTRNEIAKHLKMQGGC